MTENPYYELIRFLRQQGQSAGPELLLARVEIPEGGAAGLYYEGEALEPDRRAVGLAVDEEHEGTQCLCLRMDGRVWALCLLE